MNHSLKRCDCPMCGRAREWRVSPGRACSGYGGGSAGWIADRPREPSSPYRVYLLDDAHGLVVHVAIDRDERYALVSVDGCLTWFLARELVAL